MGAKDSKPSCINYEDAIKRVSPSEFNRIKEAFKRSAGVNGTLLSKGTFLLDVLSEAVPNVVADWLFIACGGTQKGIAFKELFCGLVLLTRGTQEEQIKFLWNLYCNDSATHIIKNDFIKSLQLEQTYQTSNLQQIKQSNSQNNKNAPILIALFGQTDRVTFEQFKSCILIHKDATVLSKWLLLESGVNLSSELETPTFYQSLAGVTHLEEQDIGDLEKVFWLLKGSALTGQLDLESLGPLLSPPVPKSALPGVFQAFDENRDGHIDFKELCCGVSAACRGPSVERNKFCFKVFDIDRDGILSFTEIKQMIDILLFVARESINASNIKNVTSEQVLLDLFNRSLKNKSEDSSESSTPTNNVINDITSIKSFSLTQEDFLIWSIDNCNNNLVQPFLDLLFEVCHIVLGLKPQCRHLEHDIVKGWLSREVRRGYKIGQFWYLISTDWWQNWLSYTQHQSNSTCTHCKSIQNYTIRNVNGVDEAMICDESFNSNSTESMGDLLGTGDSSSLGSGSSGISCGRQSFSRPGAIDNNTLIAQSVYKNIQTLTGEGGRLKRDLLSQHRDFELVPDSLWKALSQWYRGQLPLPRQVIQPPNSTDVELELYPLNLRILRHQNVAPISQAASTWGAVSGGYGAITSAGSYTSMSSVPPSLQPPKRYLAYTAAFSRLATVRQVTEFLCQRLKLKQEDVRLWHVILNNSGSINETPCLLDEEHLTLQDLLISDNDQILLEIRNKDLTWPEELCALTLSSPNTGNQERRSTIASVTSVHQPGATGLHNLGNTCFMNAALQVMFNTAPLAQYFRKNMHLVEINQVNKLGTKGQLAYIYAELLKEVWSTSTRSIAPLKLRFCVNKHAPQFSGGGQHDSQELLEWFLDALHEDLNRVTEKPYSELKDSNGRADCVVAAEAWSQHHSRNQSIVIDLFYGQLKSKVSCLGCGNDSVRFDPFSLLSLPLPVENFTYCEVLVVLLDGSVPIKYGLRLNSDSKYFDLKKELSGLCQLDSELMLICELSGSQIKCSLPNGQKVKTNTATEMYVYELPKGYGRPRTSSQMGVNIEKGLKDIQRNPALLMSSENHQLTTTSNTSTKTDTTTSSSEDAVIRTPINNSVNETNNRRTSKNVSPEMSTSPVSTFVHSTNNKTISTTNLLTNDNGSNSSSLDDPNTLHNFKIENNEKTVNDTNCNCLDISINDETTNSTGNITKDFKNLNRTTGYLMAVHRKLSRQDTYFMSYHKSRPSLFGVPLLIPCYESGTNKDLYCAVWVQVARLLSPLPMTPPEQSNHATDCDDSLGYEFPFTLRAVAEGGRICALCTWSRFCRGCEIPCNDEPLLRGILRTENNSGPPTPKLSSREQSPNINRKNSFNSDSSFRLHFGSDINLSAINIAIDWDPTALHLRYQSTRERVWVEHSSVGICRKQQTEPVDLDHCLRAFTSEEKLEQWYHCSHCKGKKPATKKLQIWKLPPILIVHLKRFNFVNNKWVKSQKVVNFPFKDFDPTPYLASVPQETILRHKEISDNLHDNIDKNERHPKMCNIDCDEIFEKKNYNAANNQINNNLQEASIPSSSSQINNKINEKDIIENNFRTYLTDDDDENIEDDDGLQDDGENRNSINDLPVLNPTKETTLERRKRLISTSLTKTPVIDGEFTDFHNHILNEGEDPFNLKYQLYAVVSHSGMLNGGHYISYASNPNGSWYCYNDSSCREIPNRPNIDPGSAYLLFYERQGLNYEPYLPKVDGKPIPNQVLTLGTDESDSDLRNMKCVLA